MNTIVSTIKEKLHHYIDMAEERKLQAIYIMLEEEIEREEIYTDEFKKELDNRFEKYKLDNITIEENLVNKQIEDIIQQLKSK
jgi:hypothetical protein